MNVRRTLDLTMTIALVAGLGACYERRYDDRPTGYDAPAPAPTTTSPPVTDPYPPNPSTPTNNSSSSSTTINNETTYVNPSPALGDIDVNINFVDVPETTYVDRTYYFEPRDTEHVYFYDRGAPDVVIYRPLIREDNRVYYLEPFGSVVRRVYIDENRWRRDRIWERDVKMRDRFERFAADARNRFERERDRFERWSKVEHDRRLHQRDRRQDQRDHRQDERDRHQDQRDERK